MGQADTDSAADPGAAGVRGRCFVALVAPALPGSLGNLRRFRGRARHDHGGRADHAAVEEIAPAQHLGYVAFALPRPGLNLLHSFVHAGIEGRAGRFDLEQSLTLQGVLETAQYQTDSFQEAADHVPGRILAAVAVPTPGGLLHLESGAVEVVQYGQQRGTDLFGGARPELGPFVPGPPTHICEVRLRPSREVLRVREFLTEDGDPVLQLLEPRNLLRLRRVRGIPVRGAIRPGGFHEWLGRFSL